MKLIDRLMTERIRQGKPLSRRSAHIKIEIVGSFYNVWFYRTKIAVGRVGELPFAFNIDGWNTRTTLDRLHALGFEIHGERIQTGVIINQRTHRKNKICASVLHINGQPMLGPRREGDGEKFLWHTPTDYHSWYSVEGKKIQIFS